MLFRLIAGSEECSYKPLELMWEMTLPQFLDEKEFVDIRSSYRMARHKDSEIEYKQQQRGR